MLPWPATFSLFACSSDARKGRLRRRKGEKSALGACGTFRGLSVSRLCAHSFCVSSSLTHLTCAAVHGCFRGACCDRIRHRIRRAPPACLFSASGSHYIFHCGGFAASVAVIRELCIPLISPNLLMVAGLERRMAGWIEHQQSEHEPWSKP